MNVYEQLKRIKLSASERAQAIAAMRLGESLAGFLVGAAGGIERLAAAAVRALQRPKAAKGQPAS